MTLVRKKNAYQSAKNNKENDAGETHEQKEK